MGKLAGRRHQGSETSVELQCEACVVGCHRQATTVALGLPWCIETCYEGASDAVHELTVMCLDTTDDSDGWKRKSRCGASILTFLSR